MEREVLQQKLPASFQSLLWSYNFSVLNPDTHKKAIIVSTINYGDLAHWRWIIRYYGKEVIRDLLETILASEFRPRAWRLASIIFSPRQFCHTPRGFHGEPGSFRNGFDSFPDQWP